MDLQASEIWTSGGLKFEQQKTSYVLESFGVGLPAHVGKQTARLLGHLGHSLPAQSLAFETCHATMFFPEAWPDA